MISAQFIIWFFALAIAIEKWYQICLLNFKSSLIAKKLEFILYSVMMSDTWPTAKKSTFEQRQIDFFFFSMAFNSSWWPDQSICHPFFGIKIPSSDISVWKFKGVDNFSSKVYTEYKNSPMQKSFQMCLLNFKSSLIAKEIRVYPLLNDDVRNLAYSKKKINFWTKTDRFFFSMAFNSSWWADQCICHPFSWYKNSFMRYISLNVWRGWQLQ